MHYRQDSDGPVPQSGAGLLRALTLSARELGKGGVQKPTGMLWLPMGSSYKRGVVTGEEGRGGPFRNFFGVPMHNAPYPRFPRPGTAGSP